MENKMQVFSSQQFGNVRAIMRDGEPWFVAADVCKALEIDKSQTRRLDEDEKGMYSTQTLGGKQEVTIVNEPGLYSLVLGSRKPEAKVFKRWVTSDILPSIRRTGGAGILAGIGLNTPHYQTVGNIRCYESSGVAYLDLEAVAKGLGITKKANSGNEVVHWTRLREYLADFGVVQKCTTGDFIPENIFYRLAMKVRGEVAERFQAFIADDVIPSIRKHGAYLTPEALEKAMADPDFTIGLLTALKSEREGRKIAETKVNLLSAEVLTWADRKVLNAIIRKYSAAVHNSDFAKGWNAFYKELLYKHEINLKTRATQRMNHTGKKVPRLDMLDDSELPAAISTAVAMCCEQGVDIDDILQNVAA